MEKPKIYNSKPANLTGTAKIQGLVNTAWSFLIYIQAFCQSKGTGTETTNKHTCTPELGLAHRGKLHRVERLKKLNMPSTHAFKLARQNTAICLKMSL